MIFYQLLLTTSIGNEQGQQMRTQSLILGFKGLSLYCKAKNITMNSMKMNDSFKKDLEGFQNCLIERFRLIKETGKKQTLPCIMTEGYSPEKCQLFP